MSPAVDDNKNVNSQPLRYKNVINIKRQKLTVTFGNQGNIIDLYIQQYEEVMMLSVQKVFDKIIIGNLHCWGKKQCPEYLLGQKYHS